MKTRERERERERERRGLFMRRETERQWRVQSQEARNGAKSE